MAHLGLSFPPGEAFDSLYAYAQAVVACFERLAQEQQDVGYPAGPSESGPTSGGGHGDPAGNFASSGVIHDPGVAQWRSILRREAQWHHRQLPSRINRLYRELGWEPPTLQAEIDNGYREPDGRLRHVG